MSIIIKTHDHIIEVKLEASQFRLKELTPKRMQGLHSKFMQLEATSEDGDQIKPRMVLSNPGAWLYSVVEAALVGWDNVTDPDGKAIPFDIDLLPEMETADIQKIAGKYLKEREKIQKESVKKRDKKLKN